MTNHKAVSESEDDDDEEGTAMEQGDGSGATPKGPVGGDTLNLLGADQDDGTDNPWLLGGQKKKNDAQNSDGGIFIINFFVDITRENFVSGEIEEFVQFTFIYGARGYFLFWGFAFYFLDLSLMSG